MSEKPKVTVVARVGGQNITERMMHTLLSVEAQQQAQVSQMDRLELNRVLALKDKGLVTVRSGIVRITRAGRDLIQRVSQK